MPLPPLAAPAAAPAFRDFSKERLSLSLGRSERERRERRQQVVNNQIIS